MTKKTVNDLKNEAMENYESWGYKIECFEDKRLQKLLDTKGYNGAKREVKETVTVIDGWDW